MRPALFLLAVLFFGAISLLRAGTIITLTNGSEVDGKLSVVTTGIHADSASNPTDTALTDVLEANFGDDQFQLNVFFAGKGNQLPPNWTGQDIGTVGTPGSVTVQDGTFTLTSGGTPPDAKPHDHTDDLFFVSTPWTGDGQMTIRVAELDAQTADLSAGVMVRDTMDPDSPMCAADVNNQGAIRLPFRHERGRDKGGGNSTGEVPLWLRLTRINNEIYTSLSTDGNDWDFIAEGTFTSLASPFVGFFVDSHRDKHPIKAVFDQVSLTPLPSTAQILPAGVVLQGGSLLAGRFPHKNFDPASPNDDGEFVHAGKKLPLSRSAIAAIITLPMDRSKLADMASNPGILMKNGDAMDGNLSAISGDEISVNSVLLGVTKYKSMDVRACFVQPLQPQPAAFEVRLKDGSIINASAISGDATEIVMTDLSGLSIQADQSEIAQIRAGSSLVQTLAQLNWKATPPATPATPPGTNGATAPAPPAPPPNPANVANNNGAPPATPPPAPPPPPLVQSWLGKNQEQILEAGMGTAIEFPMPGKFHAFGVQVALASDAPPNSTATIHILADGREIAKSPPFRAGDPPRFMEITLQDPAHITLQADSMYSGVNVLYVDPVAIRD
jgi:hypothetical protein